MLEAATGSSHRQFRDFGPRSQEEMPTWMLNPTSFIDIFLHEVRG